MTQETIRGALEAGLRSSGLPGFVAAALTPDGACVLEAVGRRAAGDETPMAPDALFWVASMTKAVTAVAALQLVEQGLIGLDDPVGRWLPELEAPDVLLGFDDNGAPRLRKARKKITLRSLLTHTSGLGYDFCSPELNRWTQTVGANFMGPRPPEGLPLIFDPGSGWLYGVGLDVAGLLIEALCDEDLGSVLRRRIFAPTGMADTTFAPSPTDRDRIAPMHVRSPDGAVVAVPFSLPPPPFFQMGGGGLYSTAADYLRFLRAVLGDGPSLLGPPLRTLLVTSQVAEPRPGGLKSVSPHLSSDYDAFPGRPTGWSLGFLVNLEPGPAGRAEGSLAWAGLSNCYYWADPKQKACGVLLCQLLPFADPGVLEALDGFERAVYAGAGGV